jgi:energy-coupling factor transport system permease protein
VSYRPRPSPLHAARAGAGAAYCLSLAVAALVVSNPLELGAVTVAIAAAGVAAGLGREMGRAARLAIVLAVVIMLINALVSRDGLTVIVRLGQLPVLGHTDITLEATVYGAVLGLRAAALILCGALYTAAVDPDEVLRLFRRVSFHSALTATLATRLVPLLVRDSRRFADAQRCRPGSSPGRYSLMRAATSGALDRALDVAAALEVRGYGAARRPLRYQRPWSRHDIAFSLAAIAIAGVAVTGRAIGWAPLTAYPSLHAPVGARELVVSLALIACALAPIGDRRGIER